MLKPYQQIAILECGEPLVPLSGTEFSLVLPHPYAKLGAPYGEASPFCVRQGVRDRLRSAQEILQRTHPGWRIQVFDAYRPIAVQQFMVTHTFNEQVEERGLTSSQLSEAERQAVLQQVYEFWAVPNPDPALPPPHSTGAAIDLTLVNPSGEVVDMGSPIDEISPRSHPQHFIASAEPQQQFHRDRLTLAQVMQAAGFTQHPNEWWHFSHGDQMWAWLTRQAGMAGAIAKYGRVD